MELEKQQKEDREMVRQHEISLRHLDQNLPEPVQNDGFRLSAAIKLVPPFDDVDMTQFLNAFEKQCRSMISHEKNGRSLHIPN